jgi:hypothetical protein
MRGEAESHSLRKTAILPRCKGAVFAEHASAPARIDLRRIAMSDSTLKLLPGSVPRCDLWAPGGFSTADFSTSDQVGRFSSSRQATLLGFFVLAMLLTTATGCKVRVDKSGDGNVKIATPFGSIAVNKDQASAADVGLPAYPGSMLDRGDDGNKSAKVDMGFGSWKLRVRVAHYTTADNQEQVLAFYRKALNEYGGVIECAGNRPVGTPTRTTEGLTCDHDNQHGDTHGDVSSGQLELKAGSTHHQHIVALKGGGGSETRFSLIELDLPHGEGDQHGTN